MAAPRAGGRF
ncbi:unnamed protein product, partial [Rotaria sordida]